jgi:hypothetical protein
LVNDVRVQNRSDLPRGRGSGILGVDVVLDGIVNWFFLEVPGGNVEFREVGNNLSGGDVRKFEVSGKV